MVLEIDVSHESVKKLEKFLGTGKYKELAVSTQSFSRKLNEERKMRIPYVDGQVSVKTPVYHCYIICKDRSCSEALQQQPCFTRAYARHESWPGVQLPSEEVAQEEIPVSAVLHATQAS